MSRTHLDHPFQLDDDEAAPRPQLSPGKRSMTSRLVMRRARPAAGPEVGAEQAVEQASASTGAPADASVRSRLEATTGADLSSVRVHTGSASAEAADAVAARAFTTGNDIHFASGEYNPGTADGDALLAHEMVHTLQQGDSAAPQRKGLSVSESGDAAEREADTIAQVALSGSGEQMAPRERAAPIARVETLTGNPNNRTNSAGAAITTHRSPTLADARNAPTADAAATDTRTTNVRVVADATSKLHLEPPVCPTTSQVYEEDTSNQSPAPTGFTTVNEINGTMSAPRVTQEADNSIFIEGNPTANDVQQAGIGDCYFLAATMSVVSRDPGKITSMVQSNGAGGATVTFWRATAHTPTIWERIVGGAPERDWTQVAVTVNDQLAFNLGPNGRVHGAQLRCAENPKASDYWGEIHGESLQVHRHDTYECARWAPLLEKAYARFSQTHGQYGGARPGGKSGGSGYNDINGGWSHKALCAFYGPQADDGDANLHQESTNWTAGGGSQVAANAAVMEQLILLQGRGSQTSSGETDAPIVTATSMVHLLIPRLAAAIPVAQADPDYANVDVARQTLVTTTATRIATWTATPPDPAGPPGPKAAARTAVGNACVDAVAPGLEDSSNQQQTVDRVNSWNPSPITFPTGDDAVPAAAATGVQNMSWYLRNRNYPRLAVAIDGHASTPGEETDNQDLSQRRADNVETELLKGGAVAPHTVAKNAHGETGATEDPSWQRVDVGVTHTGHTHNTLLDPLRTPNIKAMADLMLDLRNIGTDNSTGQRNIYGDHVYSVVAVNIVTTTGETVPLRQVPAQVRPLLYPLVDADVSTVVLRNPHHGNEPDRNDDNSPTRPGDGPPSGPQSDGTFTMSLNEFFRNFTSVESGVFPRS